MKNRLALYSDKRSKLEVTFYMDGGLFETSYVKPTGGSIDNHRFYNTLHVLDGSSRIATLRVGNNVDDHTPVIKYIVGDPLNNSTVVLKTSGSLINREEYYPFGETSFGGFQYKRYRYNGKEKDEESGLYEYGQRYYAPWVCRFISVDPLAAKFADLSPYNYAGNRPITKVDIDGLQEKERKETPSGGAPIQNLPAKKGGDVKIINIPVHGTSKPELTLIGSEGDGNTTPTAPFMTDSAGKPITVNLKPVTITAEAPGPAWAKSVIQNYQSGNFFSTNPKVGAWDYSYTRSEINKGISIELTVLSLFVGGGSLVGGIKAGLSSLSLATAGRAALDASLQFGGSYLATGDAKQSLKNINIIESGMAGLGVNPLRAAFASSAFRYTPFNRNNKFKSTLTGEVSPSQFLTQGAIGLGFHYAGKGVSSIKLEGLKLNKLERTSLRIGKHISFGLGESYTSAKLTGQ